MSVVILGGNECMVRKYKDLCRSYQCTAKVISQDGRHPENRLGSPDLLVMFTDTISHKMVQNAAERNPGAGHGDRPFPVQLHVRPGQHPGRARRGQSLSHV